MDGVCVCVWFWCILLITYPRVVCDVAFSATKVRLPSTFPSSCNTDG